MTGKAPRTGWTRAAIVAVMAYAFLLQALLLSVSGAFHAAAAAEAQGIICVQDGATLPDHGPKQAHETLCCTLSCHGAGAAGPAPQAGVLARIAPVEAAAVLSGHASALTLTSTVLPLGSRAPPHLG